MRISEARNAKAHLRVVRATVTDGCLSPPGSHLAASVIHAKFLFELLLEFDYAVSGAMLQFHS